MHDHSADALSVLGQSAIAAIVPAVIEWLKKREWFPWLTSRSDLLNRSASIAFAILTTAGFTVAWQGSLEAGGSLSITVPPMEAGFRVAWSVLLQEVVYKKLVKPRSYPAPQEPPKG